MATKKNNLTPGFKTSELILAVTVLLVSGAMVIFGSSLPAEDWVDLAKWVVGGYAVSRGIAKINTTL